MYTASSIIFNHTPPSPAPPKPSHLSPASSTPAPPHLSPNFIAEVHFKRVILIAAKWLGKVWLRGRGQRCTTHGCWNLFIFAFFLLQQMQISWSQNLKTTCPDPTSFSNHPAGQQTHPSLWPQAEGWGLSRHPVTWGDPEAEQILGNKMLIQPATQAVTDSPVH